MASNLDPTTLQTITTLGTIAWILRSMGFAEAAQHVDAAALSVKRQGKPSVAPSNVAHLADWRLNANPGIRRAAARSGIRASAINRRPTGGRK